MFEAAAVLRQYRHDWPTASSHMSDATPLRVAGVSLMEGHDEMTRRRIWAMGSESPMLHHHSGALTC
jgi:hypothetical protein